MACALLSHEVSDLTLGKPALSWLASSNTVRHALLALKLRAGDLSEIGVWDFPPAAHPLPPSFHASHPAVSPSQRQGECQCVGKVCMQKIICYLATDESLSNPAKALDAPVSVLLEEPRRDVQHVDADASLLEALDIITEGAPNLVVRIANDARKYSRSSRSSSISQKALFSAMPPVSSQLPKSLNGREYCWLTQEDVLRFLLGSIGTFSPLPMMSIEELGIIETDVLMVGVEEDAISALEMIKFACLETTAVAVVENAEDDHGSVKIVGEISCSTLQACNETAALALATLSVGDFLSFLSCIQDCTYPPDALVDSMRLRISEKLGSMKGREHLQQPVSKLGEVHPVLDLDLEVESSDDEFGAESPTGPHDLSGSWSIASSRAGRMNCSPRSRGGLLFCRPWSSLIAVTVQALAHREPYVWVTKEDETLVGIVTFSSILTVLLSHLKSSN